MEKWQVKLLDLTLRNNLLNSHIDRSQVALLIPHVAALEDELSNGRKFTIGNVPEKFHPRIIQNNSAELPEALRAELQPLAEERFAQQQLLAVGKAADMTDKALEKRIKALHDKARKNMEESGSNTLNLACGFLKWQPHGHEERVLYAPLLLLPVELKRISVRAGFRLCSAGEEPATNLTLLELLKTEYGLRIPVLEGELPHDEAGVDVAAILRAVRNAIADFPGWEVVDICTLGIFSFAKYLMWVDMKERQAALMGNPIVQHLAASTPAPFPVQVGFPSPTTLDSETDARRIFTPLSADSSQLSAVLAAARGKNFVLIGPPGTGKSQTIANMIAHSLGQGKTVLFVAEKAAALSVVYKRLCRIGLGDFCLELHSNKANKKEVLAQFSRAVEQSTKPVVTTRWEQVVARLLKLREELNALPGELHRRYPDGGSLYEDIGYLAEAGEYPTFCPLTSDPTTLNADQHEALRDEAATLARRFAPVQALLPGVADVIKTTEISISWELEVADTLAELARLLEKWSTDVASLVRELGLREQSPPPQELESILNLAWENHGQNLTPLLPVRAQATLAGLRHEWALRESYSSARAKLSLAYPESALDEPQLDVWHREWKIAQISNIFSRFFTTIRIRRQLRFLAFSRKAPQDGGTDLENLLAMRAARNELRACLQEDDALSCYRKGLEMKASDLQHAEGVAEKLRAVSHLSSEAEVWLSGDSPVAPGKPGAALLALVREDRELIQRQESLLARLMGGAIPSFESNAADSLAWVSSVLAQRSHWREIVLWNKQVVESRAAEGGLLVDALLTHKVSPEQLVDACEWNLRVQRALRTVEQSTTLNLFDCRSQEAAILDFGQQDALVLNTAASQLQASLTARAAGIYAAEHHRELALLQKEITKQKRHLPPRALLNQTPGISRLLKPCMLMSPLSVAQYLQPDSEPFDVVIFDEASQIPVWDAIGAIGRGRSAVIVGDPRQMPPTNFFARAESEEAEDDDLPEDLESILDECIACGIPTMNLSWHYRSKAESLIAFSNHHYYEGRLTTFPAPVTQDKALQYHYVGGTYLKGTQRTNPEEAKALVAHVVQTLKTPGFRYTELTSMGIVTFNTAQQALIEDLLDAERAKDESLEPFFAEGNPEAVFVKNLENVQGDERGSIYFSTTYGPDEQGAVSMNFGPLNNQGGERRLNVAVTRARASMHVFSSLKPEDINLNRTRARGAADLRHFLECASLGVSACFGAAGEGAEPRHQQLASAIADKLRAGGWRCRTQVGVSDFRVDIAVEQPDCEGAMLAGIMLDGPSYVSAHTARDRDILRSSVLQGLGWRLLHLWALDWWRNPQECLERLEAELRKYSRQGQLALPELPSLLEEG